MTETTTFSSIRQAKEYFSTKEHRRTPATAIWPMVEKIPNENITTTEEGDWLVNLGLQLVRDLSHVTEEDLLRIGLNLESIATKTEQVRHKFHDPIFND